MMIDYDTFIHEHLAMQLTKLSGALVSFKWSHLELKKLQLIEELLKRGITQSEMVGPPPTYSDQDISSQLQSLQTPDSPKWGLTVLYFGLSILWILFMGSDILGILLLLASPVFLIMMLASLGKNLKLVYAASKYKKQVVAINSEYDAIKRAYEERVQKYHSQYAKRREIEQKLVSEWRIKRERSENAFTEEIQEYDRACEAIGLKYHTYTYNKEGYFVGEEDFVDCLYDCVAHKGADSLDKAIRMYSASGYGLPPVNAYTKEPNAMYQEEIQEMVYFARLTVYEKLIAAYKEAGLEYKCANLPDYRYKEWKLAQDIKRNNTWY